MREGADLAKTEQPRDLGDMQLAIVEVANRQIAPQLLKYLIEVQPFGRKSSCKRPLAHSQIASDVFREHPSMGKQRRDRVLNSRAQLGHTGSSTCQRRLTISQEQVIEIRIRVNKRQFARIKVQGKLIRVSAESHFRCPQIAPFRRRLPLDDGKSRSVGARDSARSARDKFVIRQTY